MLLNHSIEMTMSTFTENEAVETLVGKVFIDEQTFRSRTTTTEQPY